MPARLRPAPPAASPPAASPPGGPAASPPGNPAGGPSGTPSGCGPGEDEIFRRLAQTAPAGLVLLEPDGTTRLRNTEAARILGAATGRLDAALLAAADRCERTGAVQTVAVRLAAQAGAAQTGAGPRRRQLEIECQVVPAPWLAPARVLWLTDVTRARLLQRRLNAIAHASATVADVGNLRATLDAVASELVQAAEIAAIQIIILDDSGTRLRLLGAAGFTDTAGFTERLRECQQLGAELKMLTAATSGQPLLVPHRKRDVLADPRWAPLHEIMDQPDWDSFVSLPLIVSGRTIGVLNAYYAPADGVPADDVIAFLQSMADHAALAVDHAALVSAAGIEARREVRRRLAADLHDSVVQEVFSIKMHAEALRLGIGRGTPLPADWLGAQAENLAASSRQALDDLRALIFEMRPTGLADRGLVAAASGWLSSVGSREGLEVTFRGDPGLIALPPDVEDDVLRILQEAVHNVIRHAGATAVAVELSASGPAAQELVLDIVDDGRGFTAPAPAAPPGRSLGLVTMRERAQRWGGCVVLRSRAGAGSHLRVTIPLPAVPWRPRD